MGFKSKIEEKATSLNTNLAAQAQAKYISWLMKEEDVDYETAMAIVEARTDPIEWEYVLGFKLADPVLYVAIFKQFSKKARQQAAENFRATLSPEERILFDTQVFNDENAKQFKKKYKEESKKKGAADLDQDF